MRAKEGGEIQRERERERKGRGGRGVCKQETCFEILIRGSGRGLERRDEKKKGGTFEASECSLHS